ncbi:MAG: TMEM175 family protein [Bacteroidota bacterium]|nr:TMEM175 family protein [Bacteroidota bacterium]
MEKDTSRIEAFSDGIFAVAITLLSVEIGVDISSIESHHALKLTSNEELTQQLIILWPKIFAFFNSFASVLLMWMSHHQIFKLLRTANKKLILSNGLLLLIIALVPFPTKTVGEFLGTDAQRTAILFYTGYSVIIASAYFLFINATGGKEGKLFLPHVSEKTISGIKKGLFTGLCLNIAIFIIAFFAPIAGLVLNFFMWIFWAIVASESNENTDQSKEPI